VQTERYRRPVSCKYAFFVKIIHINTSVIPHLNPFHVVKETSRSQRSKAMDPWQFHISGQQVP